jgi:DNA polymerase (family 10)
LTNKEIAGLFHELASLMELHEENPFKIRSYENAYLALRKLDQPLLELDAEALAQIRGVGAAISERLAEIKQSGSFKALEEFREKTPEGVRKMLQIKGLGPKKVKAIWSQLQIETPGELLYACYENRLIELKGFGHKIQDDIITSIEYFNSQQNLFLFSQLESEAKELISVLKNLNDSIQIETTGALRRAVFTLSGIELICDSDSLKFPENITTVNSENYLWKARFPVNIKHVPTDKFYFEQILNTGGSEAFQKEFIQHFKPTKGNSEKELFEMSKLKYIPPECRDLDSFESFEENQLIEEEDIKGVVHNHSTYSDGIYSIEKMASECMRLGYTYFVISDHSKSAGYANGLQIERLEMQWREIDELNLKLAPFRIFKSIESDILIDGSLDYPDDILKQFDLVIASVHSVLKMDEEKAMKRLIKAVENRYTNILGHPTGRLLLSRQGYPVDFFKLIDACVSNHVAIEINANPLRLDMDWKWIPYAMKKGLMISINPDAHNLKGIQDIYYGVKAGRKGGLLKNNCLNSWSIAEFDTWIKAKNRF